MYRYPEDDGQRDIHLLDEVESADLRELVRQCVALHQRYKPADWTGDPGHKAAATFIRETYDDIDSDFCVCATAMLSLDEPYSYMLPTLKTEGNGDVTFAGADQEFDDLVKVDPDDGERFIDYMGIFLSDPDANWSLFLDDHREFISNNLNHHRGTKHLEKYEWLRDYHNRTVADMRDGEHFLIP